MANNRLPRPTVYEVANAARQYMETHKSMGRYGASMLIMGYDYEGDKLVLNISQTIFYILCHVARN